MTPKISVIIPVYNDSDNLERCLTALAQSEYKNIECIVVDDSSTDESISVTERYPVKVLKTRINSGPAAARNLGARHAEGAILFFTDADCQIHPNTLKKVSQTFAENHDLVAVIGCYDDNPGDSSFISQYKNLFHHYVHRKAKERTHVFWAACGAIKRDVFISTGGFNERLFRKPSIEDIELGLRLFVQGKKLLLRKDLFVKHNKRWRLWNLIKTDIIDRGIPWTRLMLESKVFPNDLNVQGSQKLSVALVYVLIFSSFVFSILFSIKVVVILWIAAIMSVVFLNYDFYKFFIRKKGLLFTIRVVPLHLLYFWYCGVGFVGGICAHFFGRIRFRSDKRLALTRSLSQKTEPMNSLHE